MDISPLRIVLLGKTGVGKSSLANTILGESLLETNHTSYHGKSKDLIVTLAKQVHERTITITDTPGFFDSNMSEDELKSAITKCLTDCSPGPHAFLILLKADRFTDQEKNVFSTITESFSDEAFKYAVVVFTHGEQLPDNMKIEEFISENEKLCDLLEKCGGRYHVVDNKYWKNQQDEYRSNQVQVAALLNTIDRMIEANGGGYYTKMFEEVERMIREEETTGRQKETCQSRRSGRNTGVLPGALIGVRRKVVLVVKGLVKTPSSIFSCTTIGHRGSNI